MKKRVAPWLTGEARPNYLGKWSQAGVPATIWFTHKPEDAEETYFCEGEWDAIALGELARSRGEKVAVACSTSGCGTVPSQEQLDQLPGKVKIFYDHDEAGQKGAVKLDKALGERGQVCKVPIPDNCEVKGWDVSDALNHGYKWEDFANTNQSVSQSEIIPKPEELKKRLISEDEWELNFGLPKFFKGFSKRINHILKKSSSKAKSKKISSDADEQIETINYKPGNIPLRENYKGTLPKFIFKEGERIPFLIEAYQKGWVDILDNSQPGSGKSYDAGNLTPQMFFGQEKEEYEYEEKKDISEEKKDTPQNKLIYLSSNRNPTTETIERNFTLLPARHNGMVLDESRLTPLGKPHIRHPKPGEKAQTRSNCESADLHWGLIQKNIGLNSSKSQGKNDINQICANCPYLVDTRKGENGCQNSSGAGYGFKNEIKIALESDRIRATPQGFPQDFNSNYGVIVDEGMSTLSQVTEITADINDLSLTFTLLKIKDSQLYQKVSPIRETIEPMINGVIKPPNFGFTLADIRDALGDIPDNHTELIEEIEKIILQEARSDVEIFARGKNKTAEVIEKTIPKNWIVPFLQVYTGVIPGSLRIVKDKITITIKNERELKTLRNAKFRIFQDATARRERLAEFLEIAPSDILVCEQAPPNYKNLKIIQVTGFPNLGKNRSKQSDDRVMAAIEEISKHYKHVGVIDWKDMATQALLNHFAGGRGSNEYENKNAIIIIGTPWQNLSYLQDKYQAITGRDAPLGSRNGQETDPGLQKHINEQVEDELFQEIGRARASRREDEITIYVLSDFPLDNVIAKLPGCQFETKTAFEITPAAGDLGEQSRWKLLEAFRSLVEKGADIDKLTQEDVAKVSGHSRSRLAQIASEFWGWKTFKKLLAFLIYRSIRDANNLSDQERWLANTYLPLAVEDEEEPLKKLAHIAKTYGIKAFWRIIQAIPLKTQAKLLSEVFKLMPELTTELIH